MRIIEDNVELRVRSIPFEQFKSEVLEDYKPPLRARATYSGMKYALEQVAALVAVDDQGEPLRTAAGELVPLVQTTADLNARMIGRLIATRSDKLSPNTVRALLRYVRTACNIAVDAGYLRVTPFKRNPIGKLVRKSRSKGRRHLSRAEIRAVLDLLAADVAALKGWPQWKARRLQALVSIVAYTGLRRGEALRLRVDDIDLAARVIRIQPTADHRLKTERSEAAVPMPEALVPIVADWLRHRLDAPKGFRMPAAVPWLIPGCRRKGPWEGGPQGQKPLDAFKAVAARAGVQGATLQMLRRSLATHLRFIGVGPGMVSRVLRHSEQVDEEYYHMTDTANLREAVARLEF